MTKATAKFIVIVIAAALCGSAMAQPVQKKPNILIIWGDDIGRDNISAYSMGIMGYRTPNIDRIVGSVMQYLKDNGLENNTIIAFTTELPHEFRLPT